MKKIIIIILILAAAGAAVFFLGWAEFAVPPGQCGVLRSKSHGLYPNALVNGGRTWLWYKLIPANAKTSVFSITPCAQSFQIEGELPQAAVYMAFTGVEGRFAYGVRVTLDWALKTESLPQIVLENNIWTPEELDAYLDRVQAQIKVLITERVRDVRETRLLTALGSEEDIRAWRQILEEAFDFLQWRGIALSLDKEPDFEHYEAAKALYAVYIQDMSERLSGGTAALAGGRVASQFKLDELAKYGELFTKYPVLIDFLKITGGGDLQPLKQSSP
ncbi:MAG: hypothetical protein LBG72_03055 [Spirochaetaceae bacterium]|jgi:hypothetical protein|nr:hypothetical protein [Spirochaetaceae bacterium]